MIQRTKSAGQIPRAEGSSRDPTHIGNKHAAPEDVMVMKDQVVLITGASGGIGRATAQAMAREGARVAVNYFKNRAGAEAAVAAIRKDGRESMAVHADVTSSADVQAMVNVVGKQWGRIDILVNNAGDILGRSTLAEMTEEF